MQNFARLLAFTAALTACGTDDNSHSQQVPVAANPQPIVNPTPVTTIPQPQYLPAPEAPSVPQTPAVDPSETAKVEPAKDTATAADPFGVPYQPTAEVPYGSQYGVPAPSQYNPMLPAYYSELDNYLGVIAQPLPVYAPGYQLPLLYDRYCQYRALLNYYPSFRRVNVGRGPWDRTRYDRVRNGFDRSQRWVNRDLYQQVEQTLDSLNRRQYHSPRGLEGQIRDAVRQRDHDRAARLHDDLVREAARGNGNDRRDNNRDDRNDRGNGRNDRNDRDNNRDDRGNDRNDRNDSGNGRNRGDRRR